MYQNYHNYQKDTRGGFVFPFLVGAVTGGAAIGLTRPRPIINAAPNYYPYPGYPRYGYSGNYSYYYPYPFVR